MLIPPSSRLSWREPVRRGVYRRKSRRRSRWSGRAITCKESQHFGEKESCSIWSTSKHEIGLIYAVTTTKSSKEGFMKVYDRRWAFEVLLEWREILAVSKGNEVQGWPRAAKWQECKELERKGHCHEIGIQSGDLAFSQKSKQSERIRSKYRAE